MKKIILTFFATTIFLISSCSYGVYSVSSGKADKAAVCFVDTKPYDIIVSIDGKTYETKTVKQKRHKARRDIKRTANNQIQIEPGIHKITVKKDGQEVYSKDIYVSATEIKIIEL